MKIFLHIILILILDYSQTLAQDKIELWKPERVYLQSDKEIYIAGDNIFYSIYIYGNQDLISRFVYLVLRDRNNVAIARERVDLKNQMAYGNIFLPDTLPTNVYQLVCYSNFMRNKGEDSFFTKEILVANRFDKNPELTDSINDSYQSSAVSSDYRDSISGNVNLVIHLDKKVYKPREKVKFSLEAKNIDGDSINMISVSVREIVPGILPVQSISDYVKRDTEHDIYAVSGRNHYYFHREINESVIEGRVLISKSDNQSGLGQKDIEKESNNYTILVSTPDSVANLQYTRADSSGVFCIFLNHYYEGKELILRLKENSHASLEIDDKFKLTKPFIPSVFVNNQAVRSYLVKTLKIAEVQRYYNEKEELILIKSDNHETSIPRVYYKPYLRVFPSDYLPLPNFTEISRELLPASRIRKIDDHYTLNFIDFRNKDIPYLEPVIFLDGVLIDDVDQIINLGTNQLKHADILPVIRYYGEMSLPGILSIISKKMEINNIQFKTSMVKFQALSSQSYTVPNKYAPVELNNHIPDVRQSLLWDPLVSLHNKEKKQIECYTSDLNGIFEISIQGITSQGMPVNGLEIFTVNSK
ncbi:MAG: hypothetical protein WCS03_08015 [Bacteroidota bacterium]